MRDLCNLVNFKDVDVRKLVNFAVVPRKRDVGLNITAGTMHVNSNVVPRKRGVGLNPVIGILCGPHMVVPRERDVGLNSK